MSELLHELPEVPDHTPSGTTTNHPAHWPTPETFCYGVGPTEVPS